MKKFSVHITLCALAAASLMTACNKHDMMPGKKIIKVQNVLDAKSLAESGTFKGAGTPPVILPGQQVSFSFSAGNGQALTFASMYGWSNDMFFAPANPGIALYTAKGAPVEGDVSDQIKLWDNGSRINQPPGMSVNHPGTADNKNVTEVNGMDAQGNTYLPANQLMKATLKYDGNSVFTLTIENISGGTANETPFSPGVWAVSNILGGELMNKAPLYKAGMPTANGLTPLAEAGDNSQLADYAVANTKIFTPLSPVLIVVYHGDKNPIFKMGEKDRANGLADIAQKGDASKLEMFLKTQPEVRHVYVVKADQTTVLLPKINGAKGGSISQVVDYKKGDKITIATMFGYSNDWFFSFGDDGIDVNTKGDVSEQVKLFDDGTAVNQFPGAGNSQVAFSGEAQTPESNPIMQVDSTYPVPTVKDIIKISLSY